MGSIFVTLSAGEIATQIADILNKQNRLYKVYYPADILTGPIDYFVEVISDKVVGCVGLDRQNPSVSTIRHLSVLPDQRGAGLGKKLVKTALMYCATDVEMTIREGNAPSMHVAMSLGFNPVSMSTNKGHRLIKFIRRNTWKV